MAVGMYSLTPEEYKHLGLETSIVPGNEEEHVITLEVFHQLHCLVCALTLSSRRRNANHRTWQNYLRQRVYGVEMDEGSEKGKKAHLGMESAIRTSTILLTGSRYSALRGLFTASSDVPRRSDADNAHLQQGA